MEVLELQEGEGLGRLRLLTTLPAAVQALDEWNPRMKTHVHYDPQALYSEDIVMDLLDVGIRLRFQPHSQRLYMLDCYDMSKALYSKGGHLFGGNKPASALSVYSIYGPTFPGRFLTSSGLYMLQYPSLGFIFDIPLKYRHLYQTPSLNSNPNLNLNPTTHSNVNPGLMPHLQHQNKNIPLEFPDGSTAPLVRMLMYPPDLDIQLPHTYPDTGHRIATVNLCSNRPEWHISMDGWDTDIHIGMSPQDVISLLGGPQGTYTPGKTSRSQARVNFYNYPQLGIDIGFSLHTHTLETVILHTNIPGHPHFGLSWRCPFQLIFNDDDATTLLRPPDEHTHTHTDHVLKYNMQWGAASSVLGHHLSLESMQRAPAVKGGSSTTHPFGPSYLYGFPEIGAIFEVTENSFIACVTFFDP